MKLVLPAGERIRTPTGPHVALQHAGQIADRVQRMNGKKRIHMRQHRLNAAASRLESVETQQRVQPDQPRTGSVQPVDLEGKIALLVAVQPIGDHQHDRPLSENTARPVTVERLQRRGNAGAAGPVLDRVRDGPEGGIRVTVLHLARDIAEPGPEQKGMHVAAPLCQRMHKAEQHSRIPFHGSRYVTDHHDRAGFLKPLFMDRQRQPAPARHLPEGPLEGQPAGRRRSGEAARWPCRQGQHHGIDGALGLGHLGDAHHLEIRGLQAFIRGCGHRHIDLDGFAVILFHRWRRGRVQRLVEAAGGRVLFRVSFGFAGQGRQKQIPHLFHQPRIAPENVEGLIEQKPVFRLLYKTA